jgi:Na+/serine symporter
MSPVLGLSDDAHAGEPMCRISALLLLSALVKMGKHDKSKYTIDALVRLNFIGIIVESVQYMATDLRETAPEGKLFLTSLSRFITNVTIIIRCWPAAAILPCETRLTFSNLTSTVWCYSCNQCRFLPCCEDVRSVCKGS